MGTGATTRAHTHRVTQLTPILAVLDDVSVQAGVSDGLRCLPLNGKAGLVHIVDGDVLGSAGGN